MRACSKAGCLLLLTALGSDLAAAEGTSGQVVFGTADLPKDLSPLGMFYSADVIVKGVIMSLIFASILTWTIALVKAIEITRARLSLRKSLALLSGAPSMPDSAGTLAALKGGAARLVATALDELRHSPAQAPSGGIKERVAARLQRLEHAEARRINRATGILATIGATGPFVGLFGTVWGIMNSFIGISKAHTTNLAVVAPGIAEALLATAIGLIAAIPAVVLYNLLTRGVAAYRADLGDASTQVQALLSRDLDRRPSSQAAKLQAAE